MRRRVADREGFGVEERKSVCTKGQRIEGRSNKNNTLCGNYRRDISGGIGKAVQR